MFPKNLEGTWKERGGTEEIYYSTEVTKVASTSGEFIEPEHEGEART